MTHVDYRLFEIRLLAVAAAAATAVVLSVRFGSLFPDAEYRSTDVGVSN